MPTSTTSSQEIDHLSSGRTPPACIARLEEKVALQEPLSFAEIVFGLEARGDDQARLHRLAGKVRDRSFGRKIFLRGVIETGNHCDASCLYCGMRRENRELERYRIPKEEILRTARVIVDSGIRTVFLQSGDDRAVALSEIAEIVAEIKSWGVATVILCLGRKSREDYERLRQAGADKYILKHETANPDLFCKMRPGTTLRDRVETLNLLKAIGFKVGSGCIVGLPGQTIEDLARDVMLVRELGVDMASAAPFIPNDQSPLAGEPTGDIELALNCMALMRLVRPTALIASVSAFEKLQPGGQLRALAAGANVMTMNRTPEDYRKHFVIYTTGRKVMLPDHINRTVEASGLAVSDYPE